jgi:hypothetical protein
MLVVNTNSKILEPGKCGALFSEDFAGRGGGFVIEKI